MANLIAEFEKKEGMPVSVLELLQKDTYQDFGDLEVKRSYVEYHESKGSLNYLLFEMETKNGDGEPVFLYKALKFHRLIRVPKNAKALKSFMDMQAEVISGMYNSQMNFVQIIANVIKPKPIGLMFLYGVQAVSTESMESAKRHADEDFAALSRVFGGTFRTMEMKLPTYEEMEWLRSKMHSMKHLQVVRGLPKPRKAAGDMNNSSGMGGAGNAEMEEQTEEFIAGMTDYEYVAVLMASPIEQDVLMQWLNISSKDQTKWEGLLSGSKGMNFGLSMPMMYMANLGSNEGWSQGHNQGISESHSDSTSLTETQGVSHGTTHSQGVTNTAGTSLTVGESLGLSHSQGTSQGISVTDGVSMSHSQGVSESQSETHTLGKSASHSLGSNWSESDGTSETQSKGTSHTVSDGTNNSYSFGKNQSSSDGTSHAEGSNWSNSNGKTNSWSSQWSESQGNTETTSKGNNTNWGINSNFGTNKGNSDTLGGGLSMGAGLPGGVGQGSVSANYSHSETEGTSSGKGGSIGGGTSESTSEGTTNSSSKGGSQSGGTTSTSSKGGSITDTTTHTDTKGTSETWSKGTSHTVSNGTSETLSKGTSHTSSRGGSETFSTGTSESVSKGRSVGTSESWSQGKSHSVGQSVGVSASDGISKGNSLSQGQSFSQSHSQSVSQSVTQSQSLSRGQSHSDGWGTSKGMSQGYSGGLSAGSAGTMGIGPSLSWSKTFQWKDVEVENILELLQFQRQRLMAATNGQGAFYVDFYIATEHEKAKRAAGALANAAWMNDQAYVSPLQVLDLPPHEEQHLLYHLNAFSPCLTKEGVPGQLESYKYSTVLLADELAAFSHPPRISEGGLYAEVDDMPTLSVPSNRQDGEIFVGNILSGERYSVDKGYETDFQFRIRNDEIMHAFFQGGSRSGKTVTATRVIAELANNVRRGPYKKRMRIVAMDPKKDWRILARFVEPERFRFYSLADPAFCPIKLNLARIPKGVYTERYMNSIVEVFCRSYGLGERGKQILTRAFYEEYTKAGCFQGNAKDLANERSANVTLETIYLNLDAKRKEMDDPKAKTKYGNDARDAFTRVMDRMESFGRIGAINHSMFCNAGGMSIDELLGADDVVVLESYGLESTTRSFVFGLTTSAIYQYCVHNGGFVKPREQFETILVIEEAYSLGPYLSNQIVQTP
ncbi:serine-rich protein [Cytobacillus sp. FJAT-54145]|uniref:Serine-rich protein n=1 Tax=Cytobacillus spartinae TaxID=3299023 RepID=A0ABW6KE35_9BACI